MCPYEYQGVGKSKASKNNLPDLHDFEWRLPKMDLNDMGHVEDTVPDQIPICSYCDEELGGAAVRGSDGRARHPECHTDWIDFMDMPNPCCENTSKACSVMGACSHYLTKQSYNPSAYSVPTNESTNEPSHHPERQDRPYSEDSSFSEYSTLHNLHETPKRQADLSESVSNQNKQGNEPSDDQTHEYAPASYFDLTLNEIAEALMRIADALEEGLQL